MAHKFRGYSTISDCDMRAADRCATDSDFSDGLSDDSDCSAAPSRRSRTNQKAHRSRNNKLRVLNRWTVEEHDKLAYLVDKWGSEKNWAKVAEEMPGRTGKQCRERWLNHMKPGIVKGNWSQEEEFLLAQCHALVGSHWSKMTKRLPGRTENSIKNFWNATLRSKAPSKKRGILWTYIQMHDPKTEDNSLSFTTAIGRLHETRELPAFLLEQLDEGLLDSRTLKAVHKAEREFLENVGGELHPLSVPHPTAGLHGYGGAAAAAAGQHADAAGMGVQAQHHHREYASMGMGQHHLYSGSYGGPVQTSSYMHTGNTQADLKLAGDHMIGLLPSVVPDSSIVNTGINSSTAAAATSSAAAYGLPANLLTAQDPLLSCAAHDNIDHSELLKMFETGDVTGHHHGQMPAVSTLHGEAVDRTSHAGTDTSNTAATAADMSGNGIAVKLEQQQYDSSSSQSTQPQAVPCKASPTTTDSHATAATAVMDPSPVTTAANTTAAMYPNGIQHLSPVATGDTRAITPATCSSVVNATASSSDLELAYCHRDLAAIAEFNRRQAAAAAAACNDSGSRGDGMGYGGPMAAAASSSGATGGRTTGGHGPHCSCGPCSSSRQLHGLHNPSARRHARNTTQANTAQRYRSMAYLTGNDAGMATCHLNSSKLQTHSYAVQHSSAASAPGYHVMGPPCHQSVMQPPQQQQQYYGGSSTVAVQQQTEMPPGSISVTVAFQPFTSYPGMSVSAAGPAAAAAAALQLKQVQGQHVCEQPFSVQQQQHSAPAWDAAATVVAEVETAQGTDTAPWCRSSAEQGQQQPQTELETQEAMDDQRLQNTDEPAQQIAAPDQQHQQQQQQALDTDAVASSRQLPPIKGLDLSQLALPGLGPDSLASFLLSPVGLGLLSPLGTPGLMLPPPSMRSARLPSFSQILLPMQRPSINGCDWDWDALMGSNGEGAQAAQSTRPSDNGDSNTTAVAASCGLPTVQRGGAKRARCSVTSVGDDGLLIDMRPAKVARESETSALYHWGL